LVTAEDLTPIGKFEIGGDDQRDAFMEDGTELEHQLSAGGGKGDKAQFIQDDQVVFEGRRQEFGQALLVLSDEEVIDQGGGVVKANAMTLPTRGQSKPGCDMTFSEAGIANHNQRLDLGDVGPPRQVQDPLFVELGNGTEIEVGQFFENRKASGLDALLLAIELPLGDLLFGQGQQVAVVTEIVLGGIVGDLAIVLTKGGQA
jgi:hypothetical protein